MSAEIRLQKIQQQLDAIPDLSKKPDQDLLQNICKLPFEDFFPQPEGLKKRETKWTRDPFLKVYVARKGDMLEVVVRIRKLQKSQKAAWEAVKLLFQQGDPNYAEVQHVFRSTTLLKTREILHEVALRMTCNASEHFPQLLEWGYIEGKKGPKVMILEEFHSLNLYQYLNKNSVDEQLALHMLTSLLKALQFLHRTHVHCDLKMANLMVKKGLLLTDLGFATEKETEGILLGTPSEMAPELVPKMLLYHEGVSQKHKYTPHLDMWSLGMIGYILLHPILGMEKPAPLKKVTRANFQAWSQEVDAFIQRVNENGHPLAGWLSKLLKRKSEERMLTEQALKELEAYAKTKGFTPQTSEKELLLRSFAVPFDEEFEDCVFVAKPEEEKGGCALL